MEHALEEALLILSFAPCAAMPLINARSGCHLVGNTSGPPPLSVRHDSRTGRPRDRKTCWTRCMNSSWRWDTTLSIRHHRMATWDSP